MKTLERPEVEVSPRPRSPAMLAVLAALLVLAAGGLGWWIGSSGDDVGNVPEIVDLWNQAWVDGDADALAALYTEDGIYEHANLDIPGAQREIALMATGTTEIWGHATTSMAAADFDEVTIDELLELDDLIIYLWTGSGVNGVSKQFETSGVSVLEMQDGLIVRSLTFYDAEELFN